MPSLPWWQEFEVPPRVLIVNCHLSDERPALRAPTTVLRPMAPVYLAGAFAFDSCDVRPHDEHTGGWLEDERSFSELDMLVLTGLTSAYDRMLHLTAYARTRSPKVCVVAGGPAVRALPEHAARFFDYACSGDVEELRDVVADALGREYVAEEMMPRFDLAPWIGSFGFVESSRYCNYSCTFCSLTAERRAYKSIAIDRVRREIESLGRRKFLVFIDNNFYGQRGRVMDEKLALARELRDKGLYSGWGALVTSDFFFDEDRIDAARAAGCEAVYCGIESFDRERLTGYDKKQNTHLPPEEVIRRALRHRILLVYGLVIDPVARSLSDIRAEIDHVLGTPGVGLPSMFTLSIPYPKTPFFQECVANDRLLPNVRLRDLDGKTLSVRPRDPVPEVAAFLRDLQGLRGRRWRAMRHTTRFLAGHVGRLNARQLFSVAARDASLLGAHRVLSARAMLRAFPGARRRTHVATTEVLDDCYRPAFHVDARYANHFRPTYLTNEHGRIHEDLGPDLLHDQPAMRDSARTQSVNPLWAHASQPDKDLA